MKVFFRGTEKQLRAIFTGIRRSLLRKQSWQMQFAPRRIETVNRNLVRQNDTNFPSINSRS